MLPLHVEAILAIVAEVSVELIGVVLGVGNDNEDRMRGIRVVRIVPALGGGFVVTDQQIESGKDLPTPILSSQLSVSASASGGGGDGCTTRRLAFPAFSRSNCAASRPAAALRLAAASRRF